MMATGIAMERISLVGRSAGGGLLELGAEVGRETRVEKTDFEVEGEGRRIMEFVTKAVVVVGDEVVSVTPNCGSRKMPGTAVMIVVEMISMVVEAASPDQVRVTSSADLGGDSGKALNEGGSPGRTLREIEDAGLGSSASSVA